MQTTIHPTNTTVKNFNNFGIREFIKNTGCRIVPVTGKTPVKGFNWSVKATNDPNKVNELLSKYSTITGYGAVTGNEYIVVDIDVWKGGTIPAELADISTWIAKTGSGGWHYWFKNTSRQVKFRKNWTTNSSIDIKTGNSYLVMPGSTHTNGNLYEWLPGFSPSDVPCAGLPEHILPLVSYPTVPSLTPTLVSPPPDLPPSSTLGHGATSSARKHILSLPRSIQGQEGHKRLFRAAALLVKKYDMTQEEALPLLREWNKDCTPVWKEKDLKRALKSAEAKAYKEYKGTKFEPTATAKLESIENAANAYHWKNKYDKAVFFAVLNLAKKLSTTTLDRARRPISLDSGISDRAVSSAYKRLVLAGWLAKEPRRRFDKTMLRWSLQVPPNVQLHSKIPQLPDHDIWSRKGLGLAAKGLYEFLLAENKALSVADIQKKYKAGGSSLRKNLKQFNKLGLAVTSKLSGKRAPVWQAVEPDHLDEIAEIMGLSGIANQIKEKRRHDYLNDRENHEEYLRTKYLIERSKINKQKQHRLNVTEKKSNHYE